MTTMALIQTEFVENDSVAVIHMKEDENRFNIDFLTLLHNELDRVERNPNVKVLITTGEGKYYSNGVDLDWVSTHPEKYAEFGKLLQFTFKRILTFPVITIAAMNGHAFAGGALLTMAHDLRVMKTERGWFSLNEIFLGIRLPPWAMELVRCKIPSGPAPQFIFVFGKRFTAKEALTERIVNRISSGDDLLSESIKLGKEVLGKQEFNRQMLSDMKSDVYWQTVELLEKPDSKSIPSARM